MKTQVTDVNLKADEEYADAQEFDLLLDDLRNRLNLFIAQEVERQEWSQE